MKTYTISLLFIFSFVMLFAGFAYADGTVYTGTEKILKCDDPIARTDGTPLSADEIDRVEVMISQTDGDLNPPHKVAMPGGCTDTPFDLTQLDEGQWYQYGVAWDTEGFILLMHVMSVSRRLLKPSTNRGHGRCKTRYKPYAIGL